MTPPGPDGLANDKGRKSDMSRWSRALSLFAMVCLPLGALADYPSRPLRIVMPFAAGGASDAVARVVAPALAARLGMAVVVENRPGAQGAIAGQAVAAAPADGHTILYAVSATAALPLVTKTAYDMASDFAPVSTIGTYDFGMFASAKVPAKSIGEFVAYAKAHPGKLNFATLNVGEQYAAALFMHATGVSMMRVPYRSMAQILPDMLDGDVHVYFGPVVNGIALAKKGRTQVLATLGPGRSTLAPEVPTMGEAGFPDVVFESVQMLFVPARTPPEMVDRLSREVNAVLEEPDVRARLEKLSLKVRGSSPAALRQEQLAADAAWSRLAREYRLGVD